MRWTWLTIFFMAQVLWRQTNSCDPVPPPTPAPTPAPPPTPCEAVYPFTWYDWCEFSIDLISHNLRAKLKLLYFAVLIMHLGGETTCGDQKSNVDVFNFGGASCLTDTDVGEKSWNDIPCKGFTRWPFWMEKPPVDLVPTGQAAGRPLL